MIGSGPSPGPGRGGGAAAVAVVSTKISTSNRRAIPPPDMRMLAAGGIKEGAR